MPTVAAKKQGGTTTNVSCLRARILGVKTSNTPTIKKSISIPQSLYVWALKRAKTQGHNNVSRVLREGIECLMQRQRV
jgi:hypothetical protein